MSHDVFQPCIKRRCRIYSGTALKSALQNSGKF
jgi:hypothetical protein